MATSMFPIKKGSRGDNVKAIQLALGIPSTTQGFGYFGNLTASKVKAKIGKESIDNQSDLDAILGAKGTESNARFLLLRKAAQGKELTQEERDRLNKGIDTAVNIFKGLKDVFSKSGSSSDTTSTTAADISTPEQGSQGGITMTTKVLIGVGAVLVLGAVAWVIVKKK